MARVSQEFYCTVSGGGCGGYFIARLNDEINGIAEVVCPNCSHKHQRVIEDGVLKEQGRHHGKPSQEIIATKASFSKKAYTQEMLKRAGGDRERDSVVIEEYAENPQSRLFLKNLWLNRFGAKL